MVKNDNFVTFPGNPTRFYSFAQAGRQLECHGSWIATLVKELNLESFEVASAKFLSEQQLVLVRARNEASKQKTAPVPIGRPPHMGNGSLLDEQRRTNALLLEMVSTLNQLLAVWRSPQAAPTPIAAPDGIGSPVQPQG